MLIPGAERAVRPQVTQPQTKPAPPEAVAADVFAPNPAGTLETLASRSKISGFDANQKLSSNMRAGVVSIESPALGKNGRLELSQMLWLAKAVLVVDGQRQELSLSKLPRQGEWDYGGYQAQLPSGKQLEIRSCLTHSEAFARRFGVEMKVSQPAADAGVTMAFRDHCISRDLNGQTAGPTDVTGHHGQNSIAYSDGNTDLSVHSHNLSATSQGAVEEVRTDFKNGHTTAWNSTDKFPLEQVKAVKSDVTSAIDGAFLFDIKQQGSTQPLFQTSSTSPILMSIYGDR